MAGQPQTPSHPYTGGAPSIFDTTPPGDTLDYSTPPPPPQPTTWYRYWNEQYNRYFFWQETNSISTWDLPPDGDTVIDYTTKEVVSGPDSGSYDDTTATTNLPILQQPNEIPNNNNHYSRADEDSGRNMFNRHDHSATSSSSSAVAATSSLFEVHANSPAVRTDDFDILTGGRSVDSIIPRSMFQEQDQGTYPTDLSWLTNQDPQLVERSASSTSYPPVVADPLFSTATRSALYERAADYSLAGPGYHQVVATSMGCGEPSV